MPLYGILNLALYEFKRIFNKNGRTVTGVVERMNLDAIRKNINELDDEMKRLFDARLSCSGQVASVKMEERDEVFKPQREKEIAKRFSGEGDTWYLPYIKKVIQLSRKYQYRQFLDAGQVDEGFDAWLDDAGKGNRSAMSDGGELALAVRTDPLEERGLSANDVLSVVSDTRLKITGITYNALKNEVNMSLWIEDTEQQKREAYLLAYMLYKESVNVN